MKTNFTLVFFFFTAGIAYCQDKFQKCCGERKLYFEGDCHTPLQQGPCGEGEWLIMERGRQEGTCKKTPCESPIQFLKDGECIFGVDITRRGQLCGGNKRPWYSVYGDWNCQRIYLSLPFGLISDKTSPRDPVWDDCQVVNSL